MIFNSVEFLIFFPLVSLFYFVLPYKIRWVWLLISSYYFYMCWNPKFAILMALSTLITYLSGLLIAEVGGAFKEKNSVRIKKFIVFLSVTSNLGILFLFKYFEFLRNNALTLFSWLKISVDIPTFDVLLPIGISFYTFQSLSYTIDVYRNDVKVEKNLGKYALFVSFFPQLVAGPIEKSKYLLTQFNEKHSFDYDQVKNGLLLMLWGFFQKIVVADRLAILVNTVFNNPSKYHGFEILLATLFFSFQIYCDFASYSDIARGSAQVMGFKLSKNFEQPYFSKSIKEFWRHWHITLGGWFKDYLYIPLGGNRCSRLRNYFNILVVFLASGLWHGAAINYVIWGGLHGSFQVLGDFLKPLKRKVIETFKVRTEVFSYKLFQVSVTFVLVNFAWIFFRANSFTDVKILLRNILVWNPWIFNQGLIYNLGLDSKDFLMALWSIGLVLAVDILQKRTSVRFQLSQQNTGFRWAIYFTAVVSILVFGIYGPNYNAQQFIYFQF